MNPKVSELRIEPVAEPVRVVGIANPGLFGSFRNGRDLEFGRQGFLFEIGYASIWRICQPTEGGFPTNTFEGSACEASPPVRSGWRQCFVTPA